jgi:hypothetical protein
MAQIANLAQPYTVSAPLQAVAQIPVGALVTIPAGAPVGVVSVITNRFPVPPTAAAFLVDPLLEADEVIEMSGITGPPIIGALTPPGTYLEPTTGQIWPRTG